MPTASRNLRRKRRIKRTNSLLKRQLKAIGTEGYKTHVILTAILAQKGGEVTVTLGTLQQATQDIAKLGFTVTPTDVEGEMVVRLVVNEPAQPEDPGGELAGSDSEFQPDLAGLVTDDLPDDGVENLLVIPNEETRYVDPNLNGPTLTPDVAPESIGVLNPL